MEASKTQEIAKRIHVRKNSFSNNFCELFDKRHQNLGNQ